MALESERASVQQLERASVPLVLVSDPVVQELALALVQASERALVLELDLVSALELGRELAQVRD